MAKLTPNMTYRLQRPIWIGSGGSGERCFHKKACPGQLHRPGCWFWCRPETCATASYVRYRPCLGGRAARAGNLARPVTSLGG